VTVTTTLAVSDRPGFADERGDAMLIDADGQLIRVRADGQKGSLEAHPGNPAPVGQVRAVFPLGPHAALVAAEGGLFVAQGGWILSPGWASLLSAGEVTGAADMGDGSAWIAATSGIFRVRDGILSELKVGGASVTGATAMAASRAEDGSPAVWFSTPQGMKALVSTGGESLAIRTSTLSESDGRNATAMAALGDSEKHPSELWVLSANGVFRLDKNGWHGVNAGGKAEALAAGGRTVWVKAGGKLLRYDADTDAWGEAAGFPRGSVILLAADAAGGAWVSSNGQAAAVERERVPRLVGLDQNQVLQVSDLSVQASLPPGEEAVSVTYQLGSEEIVTHGPTFSLGGEDAEGGLLPYSLLGVATGPHTLRATVEYADGSKATREVPFEYEPVDNTPISWAADIYPIHVQRCSRCHDTGPAHDLSSYALWQAEASRIAQAIQDRRMPADGPLDAHARTLIVRWAQTGAAP
jgi:hypothetical protein